MNNKIAFIGDLHLASQTPIARLDSYRELTLAKLNSLLELCIANSISHVICTGDFFEKYDEPISYLNEVMTVLTLFKKNNIEFYSVVGNHDLPYDNFDYFKNTPLSLLFNSGLVKHLTELNIGSTTVYGLDFTKKDLNSMPQPANDYNMLVMHYAVDNTVAGGSISKEDLASFNVVISGHDHMPYEQLKFKKCTILRPGSFTRRTKDSYNLVRNIIVYTVDLESKNIKELVLPGVLPANLVFKNEVFADNNDIVSKDYEELFKEDFFKSSAQNINDIINSIDSITDKAKNRIKEYLKEHYQNETK